MTKNHSNAYTSQNIGTNAVSRIREVAEKFEEQNPPEENLPQNQNCIVPYNGRLSLIIDNISSRLSEEYFSIEFFVYLFFF